MKIPHPPLAAGSQGELLPVAFEVDQLFAGIGVIDHRSDRHLERDVRAGCAVLVGPPAILPVLGAMQTGVAEVDQRIDVAVGDRINAAAPAAVTAVGTALGNEFFAAKARRTVAAFAGNDLYGCFVDELHWM